MGGNLQKQLDENPLMFEGQWLVRSGRQEIMSYQAQDLDPSFWNTLDTRLTDTTDRIYDNGFVSIFFRR